MSAVYIGAGLDISPMQLLRHINTFIFVDSKPRNKLGTRISCNTFDSTFIPKLISAMNKNGFTIESNKTFNNVSSNKHTKIDTDSICMCLMGKPKYALPGLLVFSNNNRKIFYYYSTFFPYVDIEELNSKIMKSDTLIFNKQDPHNRILELINIPFTFVGLSGKKFYTSKRTGDLIKTSTLKNIEDDISIVDNFLFFSINEENKWNSFNSELRRKLA
jgi:hypothetical protein